LKYKKNKNGEIYDSRETMIEFWKIGDMNMNVASLNKVVAKHFHLEKKIYNVV